ncbi:MAG: hypothetical protein UT84_C0050G0001, partial [Candidatus Curtissbacteria bacterium GW2011_GWA1_40_16]
SNRTQYLTFNGTTSKAVRTVDSDFNFGTDPFSIGGWFRHPSLISNIQDLISRYDGTAGYKVYMDSTGHLCFGIDDDSSWGPDDSACSTTTYTDSSWHHFETVKDTGLTVYVDGLRVAYIDSNTATGSLNSTSALYIGSDTNSSNWWSGNLDDIFLYPYARTADQVKADYFGPQTGSVQGASASDPLTNGLVGYWKMDNLQPSRRQSASNTGDPASATFASTPTSGNLLVATAFERSGTTEANFTISGTGWTKRVGRDTELGDSNARRTLVIWTKTAGASEPTNIQVDNGTSNSKALVIQEFEANGGTWTFEAKADNDSGTGSTSPLSSGTTSSIGAGNLIVVTAGAWRNQTGDPGSIAWTNSVADTVEILGGTNGLTINSGFKVETTSGTKESEVSWTGTGHEASAAILVFSNTSTLGESSMDSSGNQNYLNNNGSVSLLGGKFGNGSEHVPASSQYFSTDSTINSVKSVSFWTNPDSTTNYFVSLTSGAYITASSGTLSTTGFTDPKVYVNGVATTAMTADTWQFVTVTDDTAINADQFYVGRVGSNYYDGTIDEVRLYNRALSPSEVEDLYNWAPGPVGYWKMDEGTGNTAYDSSGNGNDATLSNSGWGNGKFGNSVTTKVDDVLDKTIVSDPTNGILDFDNTQDFTLSAWVKSSELDLTGYVFSKSTGGGVPGYFMSTTSAGGGNISCNYTDGSNYDTADGLGAGVLDDEWHYLTCVMDRDGGEVGTIGYHLYVDGQYYTSDTTLTADSAETTGDLFFGENNTIDREATQSIDDVKIYNYARTPAQIIQDMNAGHPAPGSPVGSAVGHWDFDEGYGDTAHNIGNGGTSLDGNLAGATSCPQSGDSACPAWSNSGKFNKALDFEETGTNDYLTVSDSNSLLFDDKITFGAWVKQEDIGSPQFAIHGNNDSAAWSQSYALDVNVYGDTVRCILGGTSSGVEYSGPISSGTWYHIICTYDGSTANLYINGVLKASAPTTGNITNDSGVTIGRIADGTYPFDGLIDEVKIYNFPLTADQVKVEYNQGSSQVLGSLSSNQDLTSDNSSSGSYCPPGQGSACVGPVGVWKLDENTGTTSINDSSGNNLTGTINGSMTQSDWVPGKIGSALDFDGDNDYIQETTSNALLDNLPQFTTMAWINPRSTGPSNEGRIISKQNYATVYGWDISYANSATQRLHFKIDYLTQNLGVYTYSDAISNNTWQHIAVSWDGTDTAASSVKMYINGILQPHELDDNGTGGRQDDSGYTLRIGGDSVQDLHFDGTIDDVKIYNYVRTPAQIAWDYNRGAPVAQYDFDECSDSVLHDTAPKPNKTDSGYNGTIYAQTGNNIGVCNGTTGDMWADGTTGKYSSSLAFDGTNDYVSIPDPGTNSPLDFAAGQSMTLASWIKPSTLPSLGNCSDIITKGMTDGTDDANYILQICESSGINFIEMCFFDAISSANCYYTINNIIQTDVWQHISFSFTFGTASTARAYYNGVLQPGTWWNDGNLSPLVTNKDLWIGAANNSGGANFEEQFNGQIDDVRIYNYALTDQQVKLLYNNSSAVQFSQSPNLSNQPNSSWWTKPGYKNLLVYKLATIIYDLTVKFCSINLKPTSRTTDQMVQAARSGKQNIVEGSLEKSLKGYIKLTSVARASFGELLEDYKDFLRQHNLSVWPKDDPRVLKIRHWRIDSPNTADLPNLANWLSSPEPFANLLITLISLDTYLLDQLLRKLEEKFVNEGGYTENLFQRRLDKKYNHRVDSV